MFHSHCKTKTARIHLHSKPRPKQNDHKTAQDAVPDQPMEPAKSDPRSVQRSECIPGARTRQSAPLCVANAFPEHDSTISSTVRIECVPGARTRKSAPLCVTNAFPGHGLDNQLICSQRLRSRGTASTISSTVRSECVLGAWHRQSAPLCVGMRFQGTDSTISSTVCSECVSGARTRQSAPLCVAIAFLTHQQSHTRSLPQPWNGDIVGKLEHADRLNNLLQNLWHAARWDLGHDYVLFVLLFLFLLSLRRITRRA